MSVNFFQQRKRQKFLAPIVLIVIGLTFLILWFGYFKKGEVSTEVGTSTPVLQEIKINFEVLENPLLKELQPFGEIIPYEGPIGRENPFLPY